MRKLVESTFVSLDGVVEAPERWAMPFFAGENKEAAQELRRQKEREIRDQVLWGRPSFRGGVGSD